MRLSSLLVSLAAVAIAATTAACSIELGEHTKGEQGVLSFEYTSLDCLFGCGVEKPALVGSEVTITTRGLDPNKRYTARLASDGIGKITRQSESCSCTSSSGSSSTSYTIEPAGTCAAGEPKECSYQVHLAAEKSGDTKLEVRAGDDVVDSVTLRARAATRIEIAARTSGNDIPVQGGVFEAKVGASIYISATAYGDEGPLVTGSGGMKIRSADPKVLKTQDYLLALTAVSAGEAEATVSASGVENVAKFRIVE